MLQIEKRQRSGTPERERRRGLRNVVERGHFSHSTPIESNGELFSNSWNEFNFFLGPSGQIVLFSICLPLNAYVLHRQHLRDGHSPYRPPPPPRHRTCSRGRRGAPRPTCAPGSCGSTPRRRDTTCASQADLALFEWLFSGWRRKASLVKIEKYDFTASPFN